MFQNNRLVHLHDKYHKFISDIFSPLVSKIPRKIYNFNVFTANNITYFRCVMGLMINVLLKYNYNYSCFYLIFLHDFLDHLDGIVARVQTKNGVNKNDDKDYGAFIDAQCDKVVFTSISFALILFRKINKPTLIILIATIILEVSIFIIRIQNYYFNKNNKNKKKLNAVSEGKLKQKCETLGLCFLSINYYKTGSVFLLFAIKYGIKSLIYKLTKNLEK
jgi:phosphatidylglycerophosphate synthase